VSYVGQAFFHALDTKPVESDIKSMWERGLLILTLVAGVSLASLALIPIGCGPYTAVHGPLSALRAQRAFLLLAYAVASVLWLAAAWVSTPFFPLSALGPVEDPGAGAVELPSLLCSLRC